MAVHYWTEAMAIDNEQSVNETRVAALEDELSRFIQSATGGTGISHSIINRSV